MCSTRLLEMLAQVGGKEGLPGPRVQGGLLRLDCFRVACYGSIASRMMCTKSWRLKLMEMAATACMI